MVDKVGVCEKMKKSVSNETNKQKPSTIFRFRIPKYGELSVQTHWAPYIIHFPLNIVNISTDFVFIRRLNEVDPYEDPVVFHVRVDLLWP